MVCEKLEHKLTFRNLGSNMNRNSIQSGKKSHFDLAFASQPPPTTRRSPRNRCHTVVIQYIAEISLTLTSPSLVSLLLQLVVLQETGAILLKFSVTKLYLDRSP
jgi:hypothetical protein